MKLDATDNKILEILQRQGRITNAKLAGLVGISPPAMLERTRRLESSGVICKYVALVDREKIGLGVLALVLVSLSMHEMTSVDSSKQKILELDEVLECYQISGEHDYILKVALPSVDSYADFAMNKLSTIPGIRNIKSSFVLSTLKNSTQFPVNREE